MSTCRRCVKTQHALSEFEEAILNHLFDSFRRKCTAKPPGGQLESHVHVYVIGNLKGNVSSWMERNAEEG
jgi:hypothetical protein